MAPAAVWLMYTDSFDRSKMKAGTESASLLRRQLRAIVTLVFAFAGCCLVDYELYNRQWFLNHFGYSTQEGQIVPKLERADRLAAVADVITFGSSYIRNSISTNPFFERGLFLSNMAVSGGGPIYSYYALQHIAPTLSRRKNKPVILIELSLNLLDRQWAQETGGGWSEYQHLFGVARSRLLIGRHLGLLWSNFHEYSQSNEFFSTAMFPSNSYRAYNRVIGSLPTERLLELVKTETMDRGSAFYGIEDVGGFEASYTVLDRQAFPVDWAPLPLSRFVPSKLAFLRMFIALASRLGAEVILLPSPIPQFGYYLEFQNLAAQLESEYPGIRIVRHPNYGLRASDFDPTGHMNIWGADRFSEWLIAFLQLDGDSARLQRSMERALEKVVIPDFPFWTFSGTSVGGKKGRGAEWASDSIPASAVSPWMAVTPDRQYVLEFSASPSSGRWIVRMETTGRPNEALTNVVTIPGLPAEKGLTRYFLRLRPPGPRIRIHAGYEPPKSGHESAPSVIRMESLYGHLTSPSLE
jgi:hypothetical protein